MNDINLKNWINLNLINSVGNPTAKKCKYEWFKKYNLIDIYNQICVATKFIDLYNPPIKQRIWHIINDKMFIKCQNPECVKLSSFFSFHRGYLKTCSSACNQRNPDTINKIKCTNLKKYGVEYGLSNSVVINKRISTIRNKYGVDNISQVPGISEKKMSTCLEHYGTKWFLSRQDLKECHVESKYGVKNVMMVDSINSKMGQTKKFDFYDYITTSEKFATIQPLFSRDEYMGVCVDHKFLCKTCNTEFIGKIEDGGIPRCLKCFPVSGNSMFQKEIFNYVTSLLGTSVDVSENNKTILQNHKEIDIYIPSMHIGIECDGLFWHGEVGGMKDKLYHLNKTLECEKLGIRLIHIFEDEWVNNTTIVKAKLKHLLKMNADKVYARKCDIREVNNVDKKVFLNNNHIQGNDLSSICYGLYYKDELVSLMTFGKSRVFMNTTVVDGQYELIRYASNKNVVGGASRLLNHFITIHKPHKIISYADRRWTYHTNNLYDSIGFKKINDGTPNYWYFGRDKNYKRYHRFGFAKHTLNKKLAHFDNSLSEWQNMKNNGWDRIWDCGHLKYELICY